MTVTTMPPLRPLGLGELLDRAIRLYRRNFLTFIGIIAVVQIPLTLLQMVTSLLTFSGMFSQFEDLSGPSLDPSSMFGPAYFLGIFGSVLLGLISFVLIQGVATAALTRAVAGGYLGEPVGITEAYRKIGRSWLSLIGALLLAIVLSVGLFIWWLVPCIGWLTGIGILVFFWMVVVPLIAPIIVLEKQAAARSIRRAWDLARRRFWWILGFVFILFLFGQLVVTGPVTLMSFVFQFIVGSPFEFSTAQAVVQTVLQSLVGLMFSLIYLPLQLAAITLMYFDLRIRTEGFDLTLLATSVSDSQPEVTDLTAQAPPPEQQASLVTMTEMGYFVLLSLGGGLLYLVFIAIFGALGVLMLAASGAAGGF